MKGRKIFWNVFEYATRRKQILSYQTTGRSHPGRPRRRWFNV
jgi:hypothetical protein